MVRLLFSKVSVSFVVLVQFLTNDEQMAFYICQSTHGLLNDQFAFILILRWVEGFVQASCKKMSKDNAKYCLSKIFKGKKWHQRLYSVRWWADPTVYLFNGQGFPLRKNVLWKVVEMKEYLSIRLVLFHLFLCISSESFNPFCCFRIWPSFTTEALLKISIIIRYFFKK